MLNRFSVHRTLVLDQAPNTVPDLVRASNTSPSQWPPPPHPPALPACQTNERHHPADDQPGRDRAGDHREAAVAKPIIRYSSA